MTTEAQKLFVFHDNEKAPSVAYIRPSGGDFGSEVAVCYSGADDTRGANNARRLVACWNYCIGIDTAVLESGPQMSELIADYGKPEELLAALQRLVVCAGNINNCTEDELCYAANDPDATDEVREEAAAFLQARAAIKRATDASIRRGA
jgi:hypothetical protein